MWEGESERGKRAPRKEQNGREQERCRSAITRSSHEGSSAARNVPLLHLCLFRGLRNSSAPPDEFWVLIRGVLLSLRMHQNPRRKFPCNMSHFPQGMKVHILRTYKHGQKRVPDALWKGEMTEHVLLVEMRCHRRRPDASQITRYFEKLVPDLWHAYLVSKHASRNCYLVPCLFIHQTHGQYTYIHELNENKEIVVK